MERPEERVALIEWLDRDGHVQRGADVQRWPLSLGRALDNTVVLDDPHVAAHHAVLDLDAEGRLQLQALPSLNGVLLDGLAGKPGGITLFDVLDFCAKHDFEAIDPTGYYFPGYPEVPARDFVRRFKRRAFQLGLAISGTGIRNDFAQPDPEKRATDVKRAKAWIEAAIKYNGRPREGA